MLDFAIIAAGEGSRLKSEGISTPKPLIELDGKPLIERLLTVFLKHTPNSVSIIVNKNMTELAKYLRSLILPCQLNIIEGSTPSSLHSFGELSRFISAEKFCLTTVDTVFRENEFNDFINVFCNDETNDGLFAVTKYIDDEKPLYIAVNKDDNTVSGFFDTPVHEAKFVSGGIYALKSAKALSILQNALSDGVSHLRNYQRRLIDEGLKIKAFKFGKIIDIDHASDIAKAEKLVQPIKMIAIEREKCFSPGHITTDAAILKHTIKYLKNKNCQINVCTEKEFCSTNPDADLIFGMARSKPTIERLKTAQQQGIKVINSGFGIENCTRTKMVDILLKNGIPYPATRIISTDNLMTNTDFPQKGCWVKKGSPNTNEEDVVHANSKEQLSKIIKDFKDKNISNAIINEHLDGDLIKFYGVGDDFFYWFYPESNKNNGIEFDKEYFKQICRKAAHLLDVKIYGGDCIVNVDGNFSIIDFNDWPSFAVCCDEAAQAIADCIYEFAE
ncbi:MAG: NTP transferase domain-containing protein [Dysgonamonadaceae bacterium]|jgi:NDP-sugar pyrophosphorylase family protein|nr:NTP transferase domain-containing protein [Dysgonamonadaceae bacterium]